MDDIQEFFSSVSDDKISQKLVKVMRDSDHKSLKELISKKCINPNEMYRYNIDEVSLLHIAAREGKFSIVRELLNHNIDINKKTSFSHQTALMLACRFPERETSLLIAQELIRHGADVNQQDRGQYTPLIIACEQGHRDLVLILLDHGAEIDHHTLKTSLPMGVRWSLEDSNLSKKEEEELCDPFRGNNALQQACREHHLDIVWELIKHGCSLNVTNTAGNTPLHIASKSFSRNSFLEKLTRAPVAGHLGITRMLIDQGCDLNLLNKHHETPLQRAIDGLLKTGCWNMWNTKKEEQLVENKNFFQIVQLLITSGSDVTILDGEGHSLLHSLLQIGKEVRKFEIALYQHFENTVQMLIFAGCPVRPTDLQSSKELILKPNLLNFLTDKAENPFTLKQACRIAALKCIRQPVLANLSGLKLPTVLERYLTYEILE